MTRRDHHLAPRSALVRAAGAETNRAGDHIVRRLENGVVSTGEREIVPDEAGIVRRLFNDYRAGRHRNRLQRLSTPRVCRGALWSPSTIHGNPERGTGILHNGLSIGRLVWNRQRFLKDPDTGTRVARANPEWIKKDVPELRIIDDEVWQGVQTRYASVPRKWKAGQEGRRFNQFRRQSIWSRD